MSAAVTTPEPFFDKVSVTSSRPCSLIAGPLRFNRISITSSCTPSMALYSWSTPSISASTTAQPGIEGNRMRRSSLQGVAKTTLERLESDLGAGWTDNLHINVAGCQELIYRNLHGCTYFLALTWSRARQSGFR